MNKYLERIFGHDIYEGFDYEEYELDLQGWGGNRPIFKDLIVKKKPNLIIEVGTWKGQSALNMASVLKENQKGTIICVDTWLGSPEHWRRKGSSIDKNRWHSLEHCHGYPTIYYQFLANIKYLELEEYVVPLPATSVTASRVLKDDKADIIYLDASHDYDSVIRDVNLYWNLLKKGGIFIGDDYTNHWPGVLNAFDNFAKGRKDISKKYVQDGLIVFEK